jgi:hypothetical protein
VQFGSMDSRLFGFAFGNRGQGQGHLIRTPTPA